MDTVVHLTAWIKFLLDRNQALLITEPAYLVAKSADEIAFINNCYRVIATGQATDLVNLVVEMETHPTAFAFHCMISLVFRFCVA